MTQNGNAFVICQIGDDGSSERERADEIFGYVVEPIVREFDLQATRSDRDPTPGQITAQIVRSLTAARVVIADLTGRNPNVYYELGVAHSFGIPVVILVDEVESLSFDTSQERVIELGNQEQLGVAEAEKAKKRLRDSLRIVLDDEYVASSLVSEAAGSRSLQDLAPDNPIATELSHVRAGVEQLLRQTAKVRSPQRSDTDYHSDALSLYNMLSRLFEAGELGPAAVKRAGISLDGLEMSDDLRDSLTKRLGIDAESDPF